MKTTKDLKKTLSSEDEQKIIDWILQKHDSNLTLNWRWICQHVKNYLDSHDIVIEKFDNNKPKEHWCYSFAKRYPKLKQTLLKSKYIFPWFDGLHSNVESSLLSDPECLYVCGTVELNLSCNNHNIRSSRTSRKQQCSASSLIAFSANGHYIAPMVLFPENSTQNQNDKEMMSCMNEVTADKFEMWLRGVFIPSLERKKLSRPVLLLTSKLAALSSKEAYNICQQADIVLYHFPDGGNLVHPLELVMYPMMKCEWANEIENQMKVCTENIMSQQIFAKSFSKVFKSVSTYGYARESFAVAGIFPFDASRHLKFAMAHNDKVRTNENISDKLVQNINDSSQTSNGALIEKKQNMDCKKCDRDTCGQSENIECLSIDDESEDDLESYGNDIKNVDGRPLNISVSSGEPLEEIMSNSGDASHKKISRSNKSADDNFQKVCESKSSTLKQSFMLKPTLKPKSCKNKKISDSEPTADDEFNISSQKLKQDTCEKLTRQKSDVVINSNMSMPMVKPDDNCPKTTISKPSSVHESNMPTLMFNPENNCQKLSQSKLGVINESNISGHSLKLDDDLPILTKFLDKSPKKSGVILSKSNESLDKPNEPFQNSNGDSCNSKRALPNSNPSLSISYSLLPKSNSMLPDQNKSVFKSNNLLSTSNKLLPDPNESLPINNKLLLNKNKPLSISNGNKKENSLSIEQKGKILSRSTWQCTCKLKYKHNITTCCPTKKLSILQSYLSSTTIATYQKAYNDKVNIEGDLMYTTWRNAVHEIDTMNLKNNESAKKQKRSFKEFAKTITRNGDDSCQLEQNTPKSESTGVSERSIRLRPKKQAPINSYQDLTSNSNSNETEEDDDWEPNKKQKKLIYRKKRNQKVKTSLWPENLSSSSQSENKKLKSSDLSEKQSCNIQDADSLMEKIVEEKQNIEGCVKEPQKSRNDDTNKRRQTSDTSSNQSSNLHCSNTYKENNKENINEPLIATNEEAIKKMPLKITIKNIRALKGKGKLTNKQKRKCENEIATDIGHPLKKKRGQNKLPTEIIQPLKNQKEEKELSTGNEKLLKVCMSAHKLLSVTEEQLNKSNSEKVLTTPIDESLKKRKDKNLTINKVRAFKQAQKRIKMQAKKSENEIPIDNCKTLKKNKGGKEFKSEIDQPLKKAQGEKEFLTEKDKPLKKRKGENKFPREVDQPVKKAEVEKKLLAEKDKPLKKRKGENNFSTEFEQVKIPKGNNENNKFENKLVTENDQPKQRKQRRTKEKARLMINELRKSEEEEKGQERLLNEYLEQENILEFQRLKDDR